MGRRRLDGLDAGVGQCAQVGVKVGGEVEVVPGVLGVGVPQVQAQVRDERFGVLPGAGPRVDDLDDVGVAQIVGPWRGSWGGRDGLVGGVQQFVEPVVDAGVVIELSPPVREERHPIRVGRPDRGVVAPAVVVQVGGHENYPVGVAFGLADPYRAAREVDVVAVQSAGLARSQAQAVDHPEDHRDDQVPPAAEWAGLDAVGGVEDRPQLVMGEDVRPVADLLAGDAGRDDVRGRAVARHVFGQLPDRGDPPHLAVDVLAGPADGPCHRHLPGQHVLPGIVPRAHRVEGA